MIKNLTGGSVINYGSALPPASTAYDGTMFFKTSGTDAGLYMFGFVQDSNPTLPGDQSGQSWFQIKTPGLYVDINGDTMRGDLTMSSNTLSINSNNFGTAAGGSPMTFLNASDTIWRKTSVAGGAEMMRLTAAGVLQIGGNTVWHAGNDGQGSGLDADLLDGQNSTYFQNASNISSGTLNVSRLPFMPIQQGGGTNQLPNKVNIGWGGSQLYLQVDSTDFGAEWPISIKGTAVNANYASSAGSATNANFATTAGTANSVLWTNVTNRPTSISAFTNDLGFIKASDASYIGTAVNTFYKSSDDVNRVQFVANGETNLLASGSLITLVDAGHPNGGAGGAYGGGGGGGGSPAGGRQPSAGGTGGGGVIRIIWGAGRSYPSTNVIDSGNSQQVFATPGITTFVVPAGVTSISAVAVGGGAGGGGAIITEGTNPIVVSGVGGIGGDLRCITTLAVTPGETLNIQVGAGGLGGSSAGTSSPSRPGTGSFIKRGNTTLLYARGGGDTTASTTLSSNITGGSGGVGGRTVSSNSATNVGGAGGGGAGGYSGAGGAGGTANQNPPDAATASTAGGGGGGEPSYAPGGKGGGRGGGGVGILGTSTAAGGAVNSGGRGGANSPIIPNYQLSVATTKNAFTFTAGTVVVTTIDSAGNFVTTGDVTAFSDRRVKMNIEKIENALEKIDQLEGITYTRIDSGARGTGLIAQDVEKVLPEAVHKQEFDGMLSVAYGNIVGLLVEAIKELKAEVRMLKDEVENLQDHER